MKNPSNNPEADPGSTPDWMRWLDDEMSATERAAFDQELKNDPTLRAEVDAARHLSGLLKDNLPAEMNVPHADFFNSQIQVRLAQIESEEQRAAAPAAKVKSSSWFDWFRSPLWVGVGAAAVIAFMSLRDDGSSQSSHGSLVMSTYAPNPKVAVTSFHSDEAEATVLMLDGLEALPNDRKVVGWNLQSSQDDPAMASQSFRGESGRVEVVMLRGNSSQPRLWMPGY